ncbi:MAG: DUF2252 family protein [Jiangellaceae bacterium]
MCPAGQPVQPDGMTSPEQTTKPTRTAHLSPAERARLGKEARRTAPLDSNAELSFAGKRDPVTTMTADDAERVPELVPIRYGRMLVTPFTFYRGAAGVGRRCAPSRNRPICRSGTRSSTWSPCWTACARR